MLKNFLEPELENFGGAIAHTANLAIEVIQRMFPKKIISKNGNVKLPPRSPNLTPIDFFLWGYLTLKLYDPLPTNLNQLKQRIRDEIQAIPEQLYCRVFTYFREK
ncbi:hypothetical protein ILUMI_03279 [Ignelater luminosus]|uniref:Uncharacterized protein n=1 Tax=Ignelater luminosus TaxID=2038154 RepID=A0A8K0DGU1_IGNLU|nr:hypothetical protein ILUMI_03279 [Ignelater luminosus]